VKEIHVGLVGALGWPHAQAMATTLNDSDPEHPLWEQVFGKKGMQATERILRVRVTHVWDQDRKKAEALAAICGIENIVDKPEDMVGKIDGVMLPDDTSCVHGRLAAPFLDAGLPTYIDKPIAATIAEARQIVERAKKGGAPLMTMSCLRYTNEVLDWLKSSPGAPRLVSVLGPDAENKPLIYYTIHITQVYIALMGMGAQSVQDVGDHNHHVIKVQYADGRRGVIQSMPGAYSYFANIVLPKGCRSLQVTMEKSFYRMLQDIVKMIRTGTPPVAIAEMLEIISILNAAEESLTSGRPVSLK